MDIMKQLADALRAALPYLGNAPSPGFAITKHQQAGVDAREALAAYDAQQAQLAPVGDHTAEPWRVGRGARIEGAGRILADMTHRPEYDGGALAPKNPPRAEDDARRIVACVNACAGIDTQVLLDDPGFIKDALYRLQSLED